MYELNYKTKFSTITKRYYGPQGKIQMEKDLLFYKENFPGGKIHWEYTKVEEGVVC